MSTWYRGFKSSGGVYTTEAANEEIAIGAYKLTVFAGAAALSLKVNGGNTWYLPANTSDTLEGLYIETITVSGALGQNIRWQAMF